MEQDKPSKSWFWGWAIALLAACSGAIVGLNIYLKGVDALSNPSGAGVAVGSAIGLWVLGGAAPVVAHFARKSSRKTLLKTWVVGCCVVFGLIAFAQTYAPQNNAVSSYSRTDEGRKEKTGNGGYIYCVTTFEVSKEIGEPEQWSNKFRYDFIKAIKELSLSDESWGFFGNEKFFPNVYTKDEGNQLNLEVEKVADYWIKFAKEQFKYVLPCATLLDNSKYEKYVAEQLEAAQQQERNEQLNKKRMQCLYEHRNEINEQNKSAIQYTCYQRAKEYADAIN
jgi:hypothetical protein